LGAEAKRFYRLVFSILAVVTFLPVLALLVLLPDERIYAIPFPFTLGNRPAAAGGGRWLGIQRDADRRAALCRPGPGAATLKPCGRPVPFITTGLYRWVRHPLYTCSLIFLWLMPVMTWNVLALNLGVTAYFIIGARYEEDKLIDEFGQAYIEYRRQTPAFIPRLRLPG
jgi:methanethiol S-methyltransferase